MTSRRIAAFALALAFGGAAVAACGNDAVGVDACKQIEDARCHQAPACGISLEPPYHTSGGDIDGCVRFYQTACLHGLTVGNPGGAAVNACVAAINMGDCSVVRAPQTAPQCAWLQPATAPAGMDAGTQTAVDAAAEAATDAPADAATDAPADAADATPE